MLVTDMSTDCKNARIWVNGTNRVGDIFAHHGSPALPVNYAIAAAASKLDGSYGDYID